MPLLPRMVIHLIGPGTWSSEKIQELAPGLASVSISYGLIYK